MASWTYRLVIGFVFFFFHAAALPDGGGDEPGPLSQTIDYPIFNAGIQTGFANLQAALKLKEAVIKLQKTANKNIMKDLKSAKAQIQSLAKRLLASNTALKTCRALQQNNDTLTELQAAQHGPAASLSQSQRTAPAPLRSSSPQTTRRGSSSTATTPLSSRSQTTPAQTTGATTATVVTTAQNTASPKP